MYTCISNSLMEMIAVTSYNLSTSHIWVSTDAYAMKNVECGNSCVPGICIPLLGMLWRKTAILTPLLWLVFNYHLNERKPKWPDDVWQPLWTTAVFRVCKPRGCFCLPHMKHLYPVISSLVRELKAVIAEANFWSAFQRKALFLYVSLKIRREIEEPGAENKYGFIN